MKKLSYFFAILCTPCVGVCVEEQENTDSKSYTFELPVNWTSSPKYTLSVTIPKGYTSLQPFDEWEKAELIEFVPQGQDGEDWTHIISINKFINQKIAADQFVTSLKNKMNEQTEKGTTILAEETVTKPNYTISGVNLSYEFQEKKEVMRAVYFSGPYDCVGVQYTMRLSEELTKEKAQNKMKDYFEQNMQLISH